MTLHYRQYNFGHKDAKQLSYTAASFLVPDFLLHIGSVKTLTQTFVFAESTMTSYWQATFSRHDF